MNTNLTIKQQEVLSFLMTVSVSPTFSEIARHLGSSYAPMTALRIVKRLQMKGLVTTQPKKPRSIKVLALQVSAAA
jgi:DNA-binding MarR family transcriptional regulator